jgi:hypothetical protein
MKNKYILNSKDELDSIRLALIPILNAMAVEKAKCVDSFLDSDWNTVRVKLGSTWGHVSNEQLRIISVNLRKLGRLKRVRDNKGGARPIPKPPKEYLAYLQSPHWLQFRVNILEFWGYMCSI